ncbi:hypothetical protein [Pelobacter propionicus]|uniref:Uncharacterized protein n=1 Tax=Pelobacter propionicus (strain DSM 2379 / NBRC 103807 / OttBd1) TaxID=338966 RepID=A0R7T2_PELPD|nr:hypothetical protein [Pelobacter propionicus]ABL01390.1 hypothetical protein Ppro_3802 [Pelobacter propionicus DSM 2379]
MAGEQTKAATPPRNNRPPRDARTGASSTNGEERPRETAQERKMRLIKEDRSWNVVRNKTPDTADTVNLLNTCDEFMYRLRMTNFERGKLTYTDLQEYVQRYNQVKDSINDLNIDLAKALSLNYRPPRGFSNKKQTPALQHEEQILVVGEMAEMPAATA